MEDPPHGPSPDSESEPPADSSSEFDELLAQARDGDPAALGHVLDEQRPPLERAAEASLGADLAAKVDFDDLVQEAFMAAGRDFRQFQGTTRGHLRAWLKAILHHRLVDIVNSLRGTAKRNPKREQPIGTTASVCPDALATSSTSPSGHVVRSERATAVRIAIDRLPEADALLVRLRSLDQLPFEDIGERLGISRDAAEKRWRRILRLLKNDLGPNHDPT